MQTENRFFDDIVRVLNGAAGTFAGMGREAESAARERMKEWLGGVDFVSRDEFEAVKAIAVAAREQNEALAARVAALEAELKSKPAAAKSKKAPPPEAAV